MLNFETKKVRKCKSVHSNKTSLDPRSSQEAYIAMLKNNFIADRIRPLITISQKPLTYLYAFKKPQSCSTTRRIRVRELKGRRTIPKQHGTLGEADLAPWQ